MSFDVSPDAYARFMGRFSEPLAEQFLERAGVHAGQRAVDVGCGPGALTAQLVRRLGADSVIGVEPSARFVEAAQERFPDVDLRTGVAEALPLPDHDVDVALAQLVVQFMPDPVQGLREMSRVTRPGGVVAACVWDHAGGTGPLSAFWQAVRDVDPQAQGEATLPGTSEGDLARLFTTAGLREVEASSLSVTVRCETFADWWHPFTLGVGPAGAYVAGLDDERREALRSTYQRLLPAAPFAVTAVAWCAVARA